ncbi:hypothetical protein ACOMHN_004908 [Nucella lapillus]
METGKNRRPLTRQRPSRASSVQSAGEREGVDPSIRHLLSLSRRKGTESLYGSRWQKWVCWARENKFDPFSPSRTHLVNFLGHLSMSRSLSSSSVRGYRAAICTTLRQIGGPDFSEDPLLRDLLRGISAVNAASPKRVPMWDLFLVLNSLLVPPYEPLVSIQMELLSFKTVFLVALASGRRRSEIHALSGLSQDVGFHPDGSVSLRFLPEFLAKNQTSGSPSPAIIIRPLSTIVDKGEPDITLCPVRAVKYYWDRTRSLRTTQRRFFISLRAGRSKDISAATISRWISQTIRSAYTQAHLDVSSVQPRAHEVRSIATSAAFQYSLSLRDVLEAAYWRSEIPSSTSTLGISAPNVQMAPRGFLLSRLLCPSLSLGPLARAIRCSLLHSFGFCIRSRRKKDITDSDEEGEDSHHSPSVSSPVKKLADMGIYVLPSTTSPILPPQPSSPLRKDHPVVLVDDGSKQVPQAKRKKKQRRRSQGSGGGQMSTPQSRSNVNFYGTSEWQYSDDMKITDVQDLHVLDEFISQKCRELFKGGTRRDTIFDKIFRGALDEFGRELKTVIAVELQHEEVAVKYRDLFEKFRQVLTAEMRKEQTEAPLVMALNAFRGFLDEFMKQHSGRRKDKKEERSKPEKPFKRDKQKKDMVEHLGHKFLQVQFSIPTFCEFCSSLIWIMDKGQVCQVCKYTCHKKCSARSISACRGSSNDQNASNAKVFGATLCSLLRDGDKIPLVVERLINAVEMHGLFTEGLYRKSAAAPKARELRALLEADYELVMLDEYPVHTLTTVMKAFFRELPEPVLSFELYDEFLRGAEIKDRKEQVQCMFAVIEKLPKANYDLFERLTFHLAKVAMHEESTKMSVNGLSIIFAPCLLRSNKKIQAQESLNQIPKQTSCIEVILSEELATVRSKLEDISTLESAEKTAEERLSFVRASLKKSRVKADLHPPLPAQGSHEEEDGVTSPNPELAAEARALSAHIATIHKERKDLTSKLPVLETRQASSDEDMLTDETDSVFDSMDLPSENNEEYAVAFDLPANAPFLRHVTKGRVPIPSRRRPPLRYSRRISRQGLQRQAAIPEVLSESPPTICITQHSATESQSAAPYTSTMTLPESSYVCVPGIEAEGEDEIMV